MLTAEVDTRELDFMINGIKHALIGTGGDVSELCKDESRLLALQVMKTAQPRDRKKTADNISNSVKSRFAELGSNSFAPIGKVSSEGIAWYRATSKFLFGVGESRNMKGSDVGTLVNIYYSSKRMGGKLRIVNDFKKPRPSGQKIAILNQIVVNKGDVNRVAAAVKKAIGKLPASWLATAKQIDPSVTGPVWIERHLKGGSRTTKSITDLTGLSNVESPSAIFGSKAKGVGKFGSQINYAVRTRVKKLEYRLKLILSGYSDDVRNGIAIARRAKRVKGQP